MPTPMKTRYNYTNSGMSYAEACEDMEKNIAAQLSERELPKWFVRLSLRLSRRQNATVSAAVPG